MKHEIKNPVQTTYHTCKEDNLFKIISYGSVEPNQVMETGQPIMDVYLDKTEWENILLAEGIEINDNNNNE